MRILFVCLENICRSPMAKRIFRQIADARSLNVRVDSAGTGGQEKLRSEGIYISAQRMRQIDIRDFGKFDLILAMDKQNCANLRRMAGRKGIDKIKLFASFAALSSVEEVADPYCGGDKGFDHVYNLITDASNGLADFIQVRG